MTDLYLARRQDGLLEAADEKTMRFIEGLPYQPIKFVTTDKRTLDQNSISHVWYGEIAKAKDWTPGYAKRYCKLWFGVPILRAEDPKFRHMYDRAIKKVLTYEEKIEAMGILPVTSRMNKDQKGRYLSHVQAHFAEQGVVLESAN